LPQPNALINVLLQEEKQNPCWLQLADTQNKVTSAIRVPFENKLANPKNSKLNRHQQSEQLLPISFSRNLAEGSPPGYFLIV
jgi:hypothetical protein